MLPSAEKAFVFSTDEILAQTSEFGLDRPATSTPPALDLADFLQSLAAGYFSGGNDTFRLGISDAA